MNKNHIHSCIRGDKNIEKQIDEMVYKLYDLTEEEIAIIENSNNKN